MGKVIRQTYPQAFSVGLLILVYILAFLLSEQVFNVSLHELSSVYPGMFLIATAIVIMVIVLWEEILFPIKIKEIDGGMNFHNHRNKIQTQLLIYLTIPLIFIIVFMKYEINVFRFSILAAICILFPLIEKIFSGVKNYNDYLKLTNEIIEYKDNQKEGTFLIQDIQTITIITHRKDIYHQLELLFKNGTTLIIDLHEMELEGLYDAIYVYMKEHYKDMVKETIVD